MHPLVHDLREAGLVEKFTAVAALTVLTVGIVTAITRSTGADQRSSGAPATSAIARGWIRVVDPKVGFTARLPDKPTDSTRNAPLAPGTDLRIWLATERHRIVIERIEIPELSAPSLARVFRTAVDSLAEGAGFQVVSERATTFRGRLAREGLYVTDTGESYKAVAFVDGAGDLYLIAAPARYYDAVAASFRVLAPPPRR